MTTRSYLSTKTPNRAEDVAPTNAIQARSFGPQAESTPSAETDAQNQLHTAASMGHDLTTSPPIQAKLTIGASNDPYEQEADRVASQVVQQINAPQSEPFGSEPFGSEPFGAVQREAVNPKDEKKIQPKPAISQPISRLQREAMPEEEDKELQTKPIVQRQDVPEEEEELQTKSLVQREALPEEEEELQAKPAVQRQELPEEEEELQAKSLIQREAMPEEEEELQTKPTIQRQDLPEEEEELQAKSLVQREAMPEEEEELQAKSLVQRKADGGGVASTNLESSINAARGKGQPLNDSVRGSMEKAFGVDFSGVNVHTGSESDQLNRSVQARAFTTGQDIFFRQGEYQPENRGGQELLAHELTHVVQQGGSLQTKPRVMRQDAIDSTTAPPEATNDEEQVAGVPSNTTADLASLPEDVQNFIIHGLYGPQALVPPTDIGGFDASYDPKTGKLLIRVKTGVTFNDGLSIDSAGVIVANHGDLAQAAIDGMVIPDIADRQTFVNDFVWNDDQKQAFLTDLQTSVEGAWGSSATGLSFTCTRPGWESIRAIASVDVEVHEGAAGGDDHLQTTVYKVPDSGTYSVGAFVDSDRDDPNNARDQDPHNNELVMSSTDVQPTPIDQSLLRRTVYFGHDSAVLSSDAKTTLQGFAADFRDANLDLSNPVELVGHASSSGSDAYNLKLSQKRTDAVRDFLSSVGFTGINDRVSTDNQGELGAIEDPEWRRVDLIVGSGEGQLVSAHEFGHVFGLDDEYVSNDVNPGGTITGSGQAVGTAVGHDQMARDIGTSGAVAENNDGIMSLGNTIRGQHYATFGWALGQVTGVTEWQVG